MAEKKVMKKVKKAHRTPAKKLNIYGMDGTVKKQIDLPKIFEADFRPDLIHRASVSINANSRQPYAPKPDAGMRHSVSTWGKGHGVSRVQRLKGSSIAAQSPNNVGGRRAHPPRVDEKRGKKMNRKEMRLARLSALAAIADEQKVRARGHKLPENMTVPIVIESEFEKIDKTKDAVAVLEKLGLEDEMQRAENGKRIRAGRGKMRGRKYRIRKSLLVVLSGKCPAIRSFSNLTGVDVACVDSLNVELLAPGGLPGRLTVMSETALDRLAGWAA